MRFEVYTDQAGQYRWRFIASNGRIIAVSSESYTSQQSCKDSVQLIKDNAASAPVQDA